jgi:AcrR family transcriptional regulator
MHLESAPELDPAETRHDTLLEAAVTVFARYGYRKASMDEVARAAGVSRQGLYLLFADKEELFRRAVAFKLTRQLSAAVAALSAERIELPDRLIAACDEWAGRYAGTVGADAADLMCASTSVAGTILDHYEDQFEKAVAHAIDASPLKSYLARFAVTPADAARALHATARGLKQSAKSRLDFVQGITVVIRLFCAQPMPSLPRQGNS